MEREKRTFNTSISTGRCHIDKIDGLVFCVWHFGLSGQHLCRKILEIIKNLSLYRCVFRIYHFISQCHVIQWLYASEMRSDKS